MEHIVYCDKKSKVLEKLLNGTKTMIVRGAAGRKLPYGRVFAGETLYFIENNGSGLLKAKGIVKTVVNTERMEPEVSIALLNKLEQQLNLSAAQKDRWSGKKFLCLVEVENLESIEPIQLNHQKNMDDWITIEDITAITGDKSENGKYSSIRVS